MKCTKALILPPSVKAFFWDKWLFNSYLNVIRDDSIIEWKDYWDPPIRKVH